MWSGKLKLKMGSRAQALVEFALTLMIFLMIIFLIIEVGRLLYAYVMLQHAARMGARYGVTGEWDPALIGDPDCQPIPGYEPLRDARTCSIEDQVVAAMVALPIDPLASSTDANFFRTQVWGYYPDSEEMIRGFGGVPNQEIVVQVEYRVRIITPILSEIASNVRLTGTAVMINETFGTPGVVQGALPVPPLPTVATIGDTPTPSHTPTASDTPSASPEPSQTLTPSNTPLPTPCPPMFVSPPVAGNPWGLTVRIGGEPGTHVEIRNLTTGSIIGQGTLGGSGYCGGVADIAVSPALIAGHTLVALSEHGAATAVVLAGTPTPTASNTPTASYTPSLEPTFTFTPSLSPTPSSTPQYFYFTVTPLCGPVGVNTITLYGANWPTDEGYLRIRVDGLTQAVIDPATSTWTLALDVTFSAAPVHVITVSTLGNTHAAEYFETPCPATPTLGPSPTNTNTLFPTQVPPYYQYVNVGSSECQDVNFNGVTWEANQAYNATDGWGYDPASNVTFQPNNGNQVLDTDGVTFLSAEGQQLYRCRGYGEFSYWFDVPNGEYRVFLGFQEPLTSGTREFGVQIEGNLVKYNWNMAAEAGGYNRRLDLTYDVNVADGRLNLDFLRRTGGGNIVRDAIVEAIGVVRLVPTPTPDPRTQTSTPTHTLTPSNTPTATNTPTPADLVIESIQPTIPGSQQVFSPVEFEVVVRNVGQAAAIELFWVDLYVDPPEPVGASIPAAYSVDFAGVSGLPGGGAITLHLTVPYFATADSHNVYAMADTTNRIAEGDETNNVGGPSVVNVNNPGNITPTATIPPTNTPSGSTTGSISGHTWIYAGGNWQLPTGRAQIIIRQGPTVVAQTESAPDGTYIVTNLPSGTYSVQGLANIDGDLYEDTRAGVVVVSGVVTQHADLFLTKVIP